MIGKEQSKGDKSSLADRSVPSKASTLSRRSLGKVCMYVCQNCAILMGSTLTTFGGEGTGN
jgi:hypothetical protein